MSENIQILLVDDEPDILEFLSYNLVKEGFIVYTASNGQEALELAIKLKPALIVLDVMMPGMDGIETCLEMRRVDALKPTLIIFLTARGEDYSQIAGLDAGADDYIAKPVQPRVLVSRIKAMLRRVKPETAEGVAAIHIGGLIIDREKYVVMKGQQEINLPRKEFELLTLLASTPNRVFSRDEIYTRIWGDDVILGERTIDVHIRKLREKIGGENIKTIKGVGYKFDD
ncbi:MAG: response regulator transcription factor [Bacteroidota bacterium]